MVVTYVKAIYHPLTLPPGSSCHKAFSIFEVSRKPNNLSPVHEVVRNFYDWSSTRGPNNLWRNPAKSFSPKHWWIIKGLMHIKLKVPVHIIHTVTAKSSLTWIRVLLASVLWLSNDLTKGFGVLVTIATKLSLSTWSSPCTPERNENRHMWHHLKNFERV